MQTPELGCRVRTALTGIRGSTLNASFQLVQAFWPVGKSSQSSLAHKRVVWMEEYGAAGISHPPTQIVGAAAAPSRYGPAREHGPPLDRPAVCSTLPAPHFRCERHRPRLWARQHITSSSLPCRRQSHATWSVTSVCGCCRPRDGGRLNVHLHAGTSLRICPPEPLPPAEVQGCLTGHISGAGGMLFSGALSVPSGSQSPLRDVGGVYFSSLTPLRAAATGAAGSWVRTGRSGAGRGPMAVRGGAGESGAAFTVGAGLSERRRPFSYQWSRRPAILAHALARRGGCQQTPWLARHSLPACSVPPALAPLLSRRS